MSGVNLMADKAAASTLNIGSSFGLPKGKNIEIYFWKPTEADMLTAKSLIGDKNNLHAEYGLLALSNFGFYNTDFIQEHVGYVLSEFNELGIIPSYSFVASPKTASGGLVDLTIGVTSFQPESNGKTAAGVVFWDSEAGSNKDASTETPMLFDDSNMTWSFETASHVVRHEFGHAMGLEHSFYKGSPLVNTKYDSFKYTIMSYTYHPNLQGVYPSTLMMLDYLALQEQGRLTTSYKNGANTQHLWSDASGPILATIYDTGGEHDYISAQSHSKASIIDLRDGHFSSYGTGINGDTALENLAILWETKIEDAIGSDKDDVIIGNEIGNDIKGGKGNDFLYGNGLKYETTDWNFSQAHKNAYAATVDTVNNNIEDKDTIYGGDGDDYIDGQSGNDKLYGDDGKDTLFGDMGDDTLEGGKDADHIYGDYKEFSVVGGKDTIDGGEGDDILEGGSGNDTYKFSGDFGRDIVIDADGLGSIDLSGMTGSFTSLYGSKEIYRDASQSFEAIKIDNGTSTDLLLISLAGATNGSVLIKKWHNGDLGISLTDTPASTGGGGGGNTVMGDGGNNAITLDNLRDGNPGLDVSSIGNLYADGGAGNDVIMGMLNGNDTLERGIERNYLFAA